jgi:hypothetical protein
MKIIPTMRDAAEAAARRSYGYEQAKSPAAPGPASVVKVKGVNVNVGNQEVRRQQAVAAESGGARTALKSEGYSQAQINQAIGKGGR